MAPNVDVQAGPEFAQGLRETCHDMRQPVASVFALAAAVLAEPGLPQAARARVELIVEQAEWLADLIQHSLHGAGPGGSATCQTDLLRVVREAVAAECVTWAGQVRIVSSADPVLTFVHPVLLRRMVANLLSNATRAAGPAGTVTVEVGHQGDLALLAVEDTGPGFGKIPRCLGLGLAALSRHTSRYGGRLERGSGASGGARVSLWLPLVPGQIGPGGADIKADGLLSTTPVMRRTGSATGGGPASRGETPTRWPC
jgi:C4-dicarboxylate-specific signal transduction histidine kinase